MRKVELSVEEFWAVPQKTEECWFWPIVTLPGGYGATQRVTGCPEKVPHRVAWYLTNGAIKRRLFVLHSCDMANCVRPDHLRLGTSSDNCRDRWERTGPTRLKPTYGGKNIVISGAPSVVQITLKFDKDDFWKLEMAANSVHISPASTWMRSVLLAKADEVNGK